MAESIFAKKVQRDGNFAKFLQRKVSLQDSRGSAQAGKLVDNRAVPLAKNPNNTGLPDNLKSGIEHLSGMSMDHVRVHYNSSQPAQLNALAYAQGSNIHVAPGQEKHLPHEAWHVVQQAQGRVKPTMQAKGVAINDNQGLEREADAMGSRAVQMVLKKASPVSQMAYQLACDVCKSEDHETEDHVKYEGIPLKASPKHIKGNKKSGNSTQASSEVMNHAQNAIENGIAGMDGDANKGHDVVFTVPRKHRHKETSPTTRKFNVHKGGGDGNTRGFYMQNGQASDSESSDDE